MIKCKIGLVSFPTNDKEKYYLNLGEIYDKNIRQDISILYELHNNLKYLCGLIVKNKNKDKVIPTNIEEIITLQMKYKLTPKIYITFLQKSDIELKENVEFSRPELYDISCMVPLFPNSIPKCLYQNNESEHSKLFIILPCSDPISRGKIIENCIKTIGKSKGYFLTIGNQIGNNVENSCELNRRYLMSCGVPEDSIITNNISYFTPECLRQIYIPNNIFLGVSGKDVGKVLIDVRNLRKKKDIKDIIYFICD